MGNCNSKHSSFVFIDFFVCNDLTSFLCGRAKQKSSRTSFLAKKEIELSELKDFHLQSVLGQSIIKPNCNLFQNIPDAVFLPLLRVSVFCTPLPCAECCPWWVGCGCYVQAIGGNSGSFLGHNKILAVLQWGRHGGEKVAKSDG